MRAQGHEGSLQGIGGMGVIDENRCAVGPAGGKLHATPDALELRQHGEHFTGGRARTDRKASGKRHVIGLKTANQRQAQLMGLIPP